MPPAKSRKVNPLIASPLEVLSFQTTCELAFVRGGTTTEWHFLSESAVEGKWCSVGPGDPKTTRSWKSKRTGVRSNKPSCLADRQGASVNEPWKSLRVWCHSSGVTHTHTHTRHTHTHTFRYVSKWLQCWYLGVQEAKSFWANVNKLPSCLPTSAAVCGGFASYDSNINYR